VPASAMMFPDAFSRSLLASDFFHAPAPVDLDPVFASLVVPPAEGASALGPIGPQGYPNCVHGYPVELGRCRRNLTHDKRPR
jgi:hypothetical protein